jgi:hypothetical protein
MSPSVQSHLEKKEFASELKFLLDPMQAELVRAWARERLVPDPNAGGQAAGDTYAITSLYLDNAAFDVFHRRRRMHLSKYRVRRYGGPDGSVFLERKLKTRGRLAKRRCPLPVEEIALVAAPAVPAEWAGRWFHARVAARRLEPVCEISYHRLARVLLTPGGPIRLTMDTGLRARPAAGLVFQDDGGGMALASERVVLELKYRRELPALFRELVARFQLSPQPFSKYRTAVTALGLADAFAAQTNATTGTTSFPAPLPAYA